MNFEKMMEKYGKDDNFIVYSASAGTGKTHTITKEELRHIFEKGSSDFIAITFTNAAAKEMKERIIEYLIELAATKDIQGLKGKLKDIIKSFKENTKNIEERLLNILDNYSSLTISTIDSLAVRLIKGYQDKTGLPMDATILLDESDFYETLIIKSLINWQNFSKLSEQDKTLLLKELIWMISTEDNIDTRPLDTIQKKIVSINSLLLRLPKNIRFEETVDSTTIQKKVEELERCINEIVNGSEKENKLTSYCKKYLHENKDYIDEKHYHNIYTRDKNKGIVFTNFKDDEIVDEINYIYSLTADIQLLKMLERYSRLSLFYNMLINYYNTKKEFLSELPLKNVYMELIKSVKNVYELPIRFGKDITMFVIDEFQDTSFDQLRILSPFFDYVLYNGGKVIVVGDTKQSIYGFRGGDYKSLSKLIEFKGEKIKKLRYNYRSKKEIVSFIGNLFPNDKNKKGIKIEEICKTLDLSEKENSNDEKYLAYCEAFKRSGAFNQDEIEPAKNNEAGGYVEINTYGIDLNNTNKEGFSSFDISDLFDDIKVRIDDIKNRGYKYRDIAILTFGNDDVKEIAGYLSHKKIPFKSYSSLDARERGISKEIISLLKYIIDSNNKKSLYLFLSGVLFRNKCKSLSLESEYKKLVSDFESNPKSFKFNKDTKIYREIFEEILNNIHTLSAYDALILIYKTFDITSPTYNNEQAAYMTLLDAAIKIENDKDNTIKTFIDEFEKRDSQDEIDRSNIWEMKVSDSIDAITISTIHKTKGLEFPIVFYIVCRKISRDNYEMQVIKYNGKYYLFKLNKKDLDMIRNTSLEIERDELLEFYKQKNIDSAVDKIDRHYVALTRAIDELYIFLFNGVEGTGAKCIFTSLIYNYYKNYVKNYERINKPKGIVYSFHTGENCKNTKKDISLEMTINSFIIPKSKNIYLRSFLNRDEQARYGTLIHNVLSKITFIKEKEVDKLIKDAIDKVRKEGMEIIDRDKITQDIKDILSNSEMKWIFEEIPYRVVKNEMEFVDENGNLYRADRVIIDIDRVIIIDYKSGNPTKEERREYVSQVKNYMRILENLINKKAEGRIFYLNQNEVEKI